MQGKLWSLIEAVTNTVAGFLISLAAQAVLYPLFGIYTDFKTDFTIALILTGLSLLRSYMVRRLFNRFTKRVLA